MWLWFSAHRHGLNGLRCWCFRLGGGLSVGCCWRQGLQRIGFDLGLFIVFSGHHHGHVAQGDEAGVAAVGDDGHTGLHVDLAVGFDRDVERTRTALDAGVGLQGDVAAVGGLQRQVRVTSRGLDQVHPALPDHVARDEVGHAGAGVQGVGKTIGHGLCDQRKLGVEQPQAGLAFGCVGAHRGAKGVEHIARGFYATTIPPVGPSQRAQTAANGCHRLGVVDVRPQHDGAAFAMVCGADVDARTRLHLDGGGLVNDVGGGAQGRAGAALPVAPDQHGTAAFGTRGADGRPRLQCDVVAGQEHTAPTVGHAAGADRAAVAHHTALHFAHRHGRQNHQTAFSFNNPAVVHQGLPLAGLHTDIGQSVVRVELQFDLLARSQGDRAFLGDDQTFVAHLGRQERDVAFQFGAQLAFVDHAASGALTLKTQVARHEAFVADAVCRGNQAADIDHAAAAKEHTVTVADDDLARGGDLPKDGAGLWAHHTVEGG